MRSRKSEQKFFMEKFDFTGGKKILLASASPRRRELLGLLDAQVELAPLTDVDESYPATLAAEEVPAYISRKKADAYAGSIGSDEILVTADTVVISDGSVLGKPEDEADARRMLERLSGRTHKVITGVTVAAGHDLLTFSEETLVEFAPLAQDEIDHYVKCYRPLDKAGAYGIQEWIGFIGVKGIRGDYYNVMGLPVHALYRHIREICRH